MFLEPRDLATPAIAADTVVFGAGAAGITIADRLHEAGRDVLLVEGGSFEIEAEAQALFDSRSIGAPMAPAEGRYRTFGGTTVAWTGRCAPLDPLDLEVRDWLPDSGWPITWDELASWYPPAGAVIGVGDPLAPMGGRIARMAAWPGRPDLIRPFRWSLFATRRGTYRHFGEMVYRAVERGGPRVLMRANLTGFTADASGRLSTALVRGPDGAPITVTARRFVLACGGIENNRILLNAAEQLPAAFATVSESLGRYFMQHPRVTTATIVAGSGGARRLQSHLNLFRRRGYHEEIGIALSAEGQRRWGLPNASAIFRYAAPPDASRNAFSPRAALRHVLGHEPRLAKPHITLQVDVEQQPDRDSRILLDESRDALSLRRAVVDWRINPPERRAAAALTRAIVGWLDDLGIGHAALPSDFETSGGLVPEAMAESLHHLGGTRMSANASDGVVDGALRVHGVENLWVCGGSVMPTGGHANPTLTIVALALRLADHLVRHA